MKKSSYGGIVVIFIICVLAICCGTVAGSLHIGEDYSKELIPTSVSTPVDTISIIDEKDFQAKNITVKLYIPKPVVKKPVVKNDTNSTNQTTNKSSDNYNVNQKSKNKNYTNKKSYN